jgi:hypothetical protein
MRPTFSVLATDGAARAAAKLNRRAWGDRERAAFKPIGTLRQREGL